MNNNSKFERMFATTMFAILSSLGYAQLSGTLNIPGSYPTLDAAIIDLNTQGASPAGVTLNLLAGNPQVAPAGGYNITASGSSLFTPIVIQGNGNAITASPALTVGSLNDAIFKITGGDFVAITGFMMAENPANTVSTPAASNNMTEWGVALLYASGTNGAQNNAILSNTISLDRTYTNTFGVYSNTRHTALAVTTTADITSPTGSNSGNRVYGNIISNVNMGITFIGSNVAANQDIGNDIGGTSVTTGNTITNWGGAAAASGYISNSGTSYCIFMNHQTSHNVSYNTITSATVTPTVTFRGIVQDYTATAPTGTFTNTISFNNVTMTSGQTSGTFRAIDANNGATTMTLNITNNTISNCAITGTSSSSLLGGIFSAGALNILNIGNNILQGNTSTATTGGFTGISSTSGVATSTTISNNQVGSTGGGAITFSAATSGTVTGITNTGGAANSTVTISGNDIRGIVHSVNGTSAHTYITNTATAPNTNINNNTFTNLNVATSGSVTFISNNVTHAANTIHNVNNNSVVTAYNKSVGGGTVLFYNSFSTSLTAVSETNTGNNFSNLTFTGATTITGWRCGDGSTTAPFGPGKTVTNNTFNNIVGGTSGIQILEVDYSNSGSTTNNISGNIISNISGGGAVTGIVSGQGSQNFFNNTIIGLSSTGGSQVAGLSFTGGALQNISKNKIADLQGSAAASTVNGIRITAGTTSNVFNNTIGDLRAPAADGGNQVIGIVVTGGTTINAYYNTIRLNASSSGTTFGSSGISVSSTPTFVMRNNIVINKSTTNGAAFTVAYRRTTTALATYDASSNNNILFAGTPGTTNLIFYDGTNSDQTINAFQTRVNPRDNVSRTEDVVFLSTSSLSSSFLHVDASVPTFAESGGANIVSYTDDFDSNIRQGNGGYTGSGTAPDIGADEFSGTAIIVCAGSPTAGTVSGTSSLCPGNSGTTLTLSGASADNGISHQWQSSSTAGGPYTNMGTALTQVTGSLSATTYYIVTTTCSFSGLSSSSSEYTVTVNALPTVTASADNAAICTGSNVTLTGGGANSYAWTGGATNGVAFAPSATDTYTVTGTDGNGCMNTATTTVTVNALPTVTASADNAAICAGSNVTLTGSGANSYTWTGGATDGVAFAPSATDTYTVTGTDGNGCMNTATTTVTVNALPTVTANADNAAICAGSNVTLTGGGANSYTWTGGVTDGVAFAPSATDTYTVTGTDGNGCMNTATTTVTVNTLPTVTANADNAAICTGGNVTLTGGGANSYTWTGGVADGVAFAPSATDTYTVTGTDGNGCMNTATTTVTVNALPTVTASADNAAICAGSNVTLTGGGANSYTWTGGATDGVAFAPSATDTYTVTGTDGNGCMNTATTTVTVNALPTVTMTPFTVSVCDNTTAFTLTGESPAGGVYSGTGVSAGMFDPGVSGAGMFLITYMYTDGNGCMNSDTSTITVDLCSGIAAATSTAEISVYPNPASGMVTVSIDNANFTEVMMSIVDIQGKVVYQSNEKNVTASYNKQINIESLAKGVYYIKLNAGSDITIKKLIVN